MSYDLGYCITVRNMKKEFKGFRAFALLAVLPLVATAAASAQQWMTENSPIGSAPTLAAATTKAAPSQRMHTIALNQSGAVEGRVAAFDRATNELGGLKSQRVFFVKDGVVANETMTAADGSFVIDGLAEGTYSFVATGDAGFAAYGVQVVAEGKSNGNNIMEAAAVSPDTSLIQGILADQLPAQVSAAIEASAETFEGILAGSNRVQLQNKQLKGRLTALIGGNDLLEGTTVHLIQNGKEVAEVVVDNAGDFVVSNLESGVYEFIASGKAGFAAVSFEAVEVAAVDTDEMAVSLQEYADSDMLEVGLAGFQDFGVVSDAVTYGGGDFSGGCGLECAGDNFACGGAMGGSCGACGGGSGGGIGGRLLGGRGFGRFLLLGAAVAIPLAVSNPSAKSPKG